MKKLMVMTLAVGLAMAALLASSSEVSPVPAREVNARAVNPVTWPPVEARTEAYELIPSEVRTGGESGRAYEVYAHGLKDDWGYGAKGISNQTDYCVVVPPVAGHRKDAPLVVLLHSAGCMISNRCVRGTGFNHLKGMFRKGNAGIYSIPDDFYAFFPDCGVTAGTDWWWGNRDGGTVDASFTPCERRVLDELEWVVRKYGIDRNRIYMAGNSMGGSGTLGFGLRHGEIFAAVKANVPAGVGHALGGLARRRKATADLPDPPVVIDYSAPNDSWSKGHEKLVAAMREGKFSYHFYWGSFGHNGLHAKVRPYNDLYEGIDWLNIRRDEAYPVFTGATTDEKIPWPCDHEAAGKLPPGQINGYFRWKNVKDEPQTFEMDLWLVSAEEAKSKLFKIPTESVVDLTLRRLQRFGVRPGETVSWSFGSCRGTVTADTTGHLTLPQLRFTTDRQRLCLTSSEGR